MERQLKRGSKSERGTESENENEQKNSPTIVCHFLPTSLFFFKKTINASKVKFLLATSED